MPPTASEPVAHQNRGSLPGYTHQRQLVGSVSGSLARSLMGSRLTFFQERGAVAGRRPVARTGTGEPRGRPVPSSIRRIGAATGGVRLKGEKLE